MVPRFSLNKLFQPFHGERVLNENGCPVFCLATQHLEQSNNAAEHLDVDFCFVPRTQDTFCTKANRVLHPSI